MDVLLVFAGFVALLATLGAVASQFGSETRPGFAPYASGQ